MTSVVSRADPQLDQSARRSRYLRSTSPARHCPQRVDNRSRSSSSCRPTSFVNPLSTGEGHTSTQAMIDAGTFRSAKVDYSFGHRLQTVF